MPVQIPSADLIAQSRLAVLSITEFAALDQVLAFLHDSADAISEANQELLDAQHAAVDAKNAADLAEGRLTAANAALADVTAQTTAKQGELTQAQQALDVIRAEEQKLLDFLTGLGKPVITILGANPLLLNVGDAFTDPGATASIGTVVATGAVDTATAGTYMITYTAGTSVATRVVTVAAVVGPAAPVITLNPMPDGSTTNVTVTQPAIFTDPGATSSDKGTVTATGAVVDMPGVYTLTYSEAGAVDVVRTVTVVAVGTTTGTASITLLPDANPINLTVGDAFKDPGFTALDAAGADATAQVVVTGTVDTTTPGADTLTYTLGTVVVVRTVNVNPVAAPLAARRR